MSQTEHHEHEPVEAAEARRGGARRADGTPFRVGLVDDHEIVAVAVRACLDDMSEADFVGAAGTVDELLSVFDDLDLVVLDLRLADGSSPVANVERLRAAGLRVLAFTSGENPYLVRAAARTDIAGVIRKSEPVGVLQDAIRRAANDDPVVSPDWAAALDADPSLRDAGLSQQEQRVLALFASGVKAQTVASNLAISVGTVDDYVRRIRAKYARAHRPAHTKVDLYKRALEDGFLPLPDTAGASGD
ncbi:DNA-binding response regulator [Pseudoclavibacter endophyticus]|uniref:Response regulator transcription factor n=1 Tax=Pseudoclavibacter endophyticus TaxID=1778590 RepID=A0A6H9WLT3_9MICO|nr:LuxR C-terminal-related transcriptional regulator [Pseudoclavibacter endophyticus]KAB1649018.1 response regulator transcription factor [Pseudoclavibacter endophyticus]GGA66178.1 DNA-binding response regulator [Pseudoclavibacter endophyticus]